MNKHERYVDVCKQMELLSIKDVSTKRQKNNGTVAWQLPIKINYPGNADRFIEVASFKTGYVRNQNCGYSNYQLNKRCESEPQYYPVHEWCDKANDYIKTDKFRQYTTRSCVLIPNEIDRLEYLIAYCLKNYYIKNANQVANGGYVEQWYHDRKLKQANKFDCGHSDRIGELEDRIYELESQVDVANDKLVNSKDYTTDLKAERNMLREELSATKVRQDVSVIVNGHRYKVL
jgi:hypothetical protein